ncbi:hypothetical protein Daus18300_003135 [Diaporthe australafricana]|uniref:Myb-like domain-containing protein n=1 Tax=Diaporthe australafricana TaxID=127596 RepID=A0ABR3XI60_9PEZI
MPFDKIYSRKMFHLLNGYVNGNGKGDVNANTDGNANDLAVPPSTQAGSVPANMLALFSQDGILPPLFAAPIPMPMPVPIPAGAGDHPAQQAPSAATTTTTATATATTTRRRWTQTEEDDLTRRRHKGESFKDIGAALDRTEAACETKAK